MQTGPAPTPPDKEPDRRFDLIVLGGTGFVGRLVAEEIATNYQVLPSLALTG